MNYNRFLARGLLPARLREIVILRVAFLNKSEFEWVEHVQIGKSVGLEERDFAAVREGDEADWWSDAERYGLRAADALWKQHDIDDELWDKLSSVLDNRQLMELLFLIGTYTLMAWVLRAVRMPLENK